MVKIGEEYCAFNMGPDTPESRRGVALAMKRAEKRHGIKLGPIVYSQTAIDATEAFGGTAKVVGFENIR